MSMQSIAWQLMSEADYDEYLQSHQPHTITIEYDQDWEEYLVPDGFGDFYHTDCKYDAFDTCRAIHGILCHPVFNQ